MVRSFLCCFLIFFASFFYIFGACGSRCRSCCCRRRCCCCCSRRCGSCCGSACCSCCGCRSGGCSLLPLFIFSTQIKTASCCCFLTCFDCKPFILSKDSKKQDNNNFAPHFEDLSY